MTMSPDQVRIYEIKRVDVEGAIVIDGFPSVGLVSSIVANYLIDTLEMEQIGIVESPAFPTVSLIRNGDPQHPVRIYAGRPPADLHRERIFVTRDQQERIEGKKLRRMLVQEEAEIKRGAKVVTKNEQQRLRIPEVEHFLFFGMDRQPHLSQDRLKGHGTNWRPIFLTRAW